MVDKDKNFKINEKNPNPMLSPRYTQIATFMRTPLVTEYSDLDIALVGVLFDGGVTNRRCLRFSVCWPKPGIIVGGESQGLQTHFLTMNCEVIEGKTGKLNDTCC